MGDGTDRPDATSGKAITGASDVEQAHYEVRIQPCRGVWARWRGRVVKVDPSGKRRYWPTRRAHTRDRLVAALWQEVMWDIKWHTRSASAALIELDSETPLESRVG